MTFPNAKTSTITQQRIKELSCVVNSFKDADIDPSVRRETVESLKPAIMAISNTLRDVKIPFGMVFDISTAEELVDGTAEPYIDIFIPGGPVIDPVIDIAKMFDNDDIQSQLRRQFSAENLQSTVEEAGASEFPGIPLRAWLKAVNDGETIVGYWEFVSGIVIDQAKSEIQDKMSGSSDVE